MAGIGFELKRLFRKEGVLASFRAYSYTGIVCTGPMLLGILLILGVLLLCKWSGTARADRDLLVCMITYTLLASLLVTSFLSMVVTRFVSDMLYEEKLEKILPSFWGSTGIMLVTGDLLYGLFLLFSEATVIQGILCMVLFGELVVVWNAMSYLTAIKDYRGILLSFVVAVLVTFLVGVLVLWMGLPAVEGMLLAVSTGYGVMMIWDMVLLYQFFPQSEGGAFTFLRWLDEYLKLAFVGLLTTVGMFAHLVIMWIGPVGMKVKGLFYGAPYYDVPALLAFLTCMITTVNFVVSVEVNFYPKYRNYYSLYNDKGSIKDIMQAEREMVDVLRGELKYTSLKQLFTTALAISVGGTLLKYLPLGFNDLMEGYFRILCVGYGLYAIGNMILLLLLYFTDYRGALMAAGIFAAATVVGTGILLLVPKVYFGFGFMLGCAVFLGFALMRLDALTGSLSYYVLSVQPVVMEEKKGVFTRIGDFLDRKTKRGEPLEEEKI